MHAVAHSAGDSEDVLSGCAAAVRNRQGMLGRQACTTLSDLAGLALQTEALLETGVLNQPGSRELHVIGVLDTRGERGSLHDHREVRGALGQGIQGRARNDRVGEEGTGGEGITVLGVEHHALGTAQLQHLSRTRADSAR